jgi:glycosyltransferase involved in cell wall biosynthesis
VSERLGVSFVIPVRNGARWLDEVLTRVYAQGDGRPLEVIAVDDRSADGSRAILERWAQARGLRLLEGEGRGAAAAINLAISQAGQPIVCQVDQDVLLEPGWMVALASELERAPDVAAAQGWYLTPRDAGVLARAMGCDLEERYLRIEGDALDHVCSGNSAYRRSALEAVGGFDATLGYGYDNDLSYRLTAAGYRLVFRRDARSIHRWRERLGAYLRQQYGVGYGRLEVMRRHPRRLSGDQVSGLRMILHVPGLAVVLAASAAAAVLPGGWARPCAALALIVFAAMALERAVAALAAYRRLRDPAALSFPALHLLRDAAWLWALVRWSWDRVRRRPSRPSASMAGDP